MRPAPCTRTSTSSPARDRVGRSSTSSRPSMIVTRSQARRPRDATVGTVTVGRLIPRRRRWPRSSSTRARPRACSPITGELDAATVSACPACRSSRRGRRSRSSTCSTPRRRSARRRLVDLADDAPTLHLYVVDLATAVRARRLARSAVRRMGRRQSKALRPRRVADRSATARASNASSTSRMNASTSVIAAGSMLSPRCRSSQ